SGVILFNQNADNPNGPFTLTESGTYLLFIYGSGSDSGPYQFSVLNSALSSMPLSLGTATSGSIANPGDQAVYTFTGAPGQRITYAPTNTSSSLGVLLRGPDGQILYNQNASNPNDPQILNEAGSYTLILYGPGANVGSYSFTLFNNLLTTSTLTLGTVAS